MNAAPRAVHLGAAHTWQDRLPGPITARWPQGERFIEVFRRGSLAIELYAPRGGDGQTPHERDEVYFVVSGQAQFVAAGVHTPCVAGDALFVAAGIEHRFEESSEDFSTWVVFYGPPGGER